MIDGDDTTVRNLTLQGAHGPAGNGAGIRAEGGSLTVDGVRFIGNQDGILAADSPQATLRISGSTFLRNGSCANPNGCAHGVYVGTWSLLRIERTRFGATREGHHVKSKARRTEIAGSTIEDGPDGTSSYLVDLPVGGSLLIEGSALEKGPNCSNRGVAVLIGEDGPGNPTDEITLRGNHFANDMPQSTVLVRNLTGTAARLSANRLSGPVTPLVGPGSVRP